MSEDIRSLIAAARPGSRVTVIIVEVPWDMPAEDSQDRSLVEASVAGLPPSVPDRFRQLLATRQKPFTATELAEYLSAEPKTVQAWCRGSRLPGATKLGRLGWRIPPSAIVAFLAADGREGRSRAPVAVNHRMSDAAPGVLSTESNASGPTDPPFDPAALSIWREKLPLRSRVVDGNAARQPQR
jgi:hypothetical protein